MAHDPSNKGEAEQLFTEALQIDPANETVLTMFAIFKCNGLEFSPSSTSFLFNQIFFFGILGINLKTPQIYTNVQFIVLVVKKNFFNMPLYSMPFALKVAL